MINIIAFILQDDFVYPSFPIFLKPVILNNNASNSNAIINNIIKPEKKKVQPSNNKWDEVECIFCKQKGDGREGEGALFELPIKKKKQFAHWICTLSV